MDIAVLADWIATETLIPVHRIAHTWAGLRSFVAGEVPVVGFDPNVLNFFWLAGQCGYGIMMEPALSQLAKNLLLDTSTAFPKGTAFDVRSVSPLRVKTGKANLWTHD
jgi:D-arginine dehydrogenase